MRFCTKWVHAFALVTGIVLGSTALGQEKKPDPSKPAAPDAKKDSGGKEGTPPGMTPEQAAEMAAAMKAGTPGAEHKNLEYMIGTWDVTLKLWMAPEAPAQESKGSSTAEWILGGRYTRYTFTSDFMGMPFEGRGVTGYDNIEQKYFSIWLDNMSTHALKDSGTYDAATKTFNFVGEFKDATGKTIKARNVIKVVSNDQHVMTFYHTEPGKPEQKVMELTYNRKK